MITSSGKSQFALNFLSFTNSLILNTSKTSLNPLRLTSTVNFFVHLTHQKGEISLKTLTSIFTINFLNKIIKFVSSLFQFSGTFSFVFTYLFDSFFLTALKMLKLYTHHFVTTFLITFRELKKL